MNNVSTSRLKSVVKRVKCQTCLGTGEIMVELSHGSDTYWDAVGCDNCDYTGFVNVETYAPVEQPE